MKIYVTIKLKNCIIILLFLLCNITSVENMYFGFGPTNAMIYHVKSNKIARLLNLKSGVDYTTKSWAMSNTRDFLNMEDCYISLDENGDDPNCHYTLYCTSSGHWSENFYIYTSPSSFTYNTINYRNGAYAPLKKWQDNVVSDLVTSNSNNSAINDYLNSTHYPSSIDACIIHTADLSCISHALKIARRQIPMKRMGVYRMVSYYFIQDFITSRSDGLGSFTFTLSIPNWVSDSNITWWITSIFLDFARNNGMILGGMGNTRYATGNGNTDQALTLLSSLFYKYRWNGQLN